MERPGKELGLLHHNGDGCQGFLPLRLPSSPPLPASWAFCLPHHREGMTPRNANCLHSAFKFQPSGCWGIQEIKIGPRAENCPRMAEPHGTCQHSMVRLAVPGNRAQAVGTGMRPEGPHTHSVAETMERTRRPPTARGSVLRAPSELSRNSARVTHKMGHETEIKVKNCRKIRFHICYLSVGGLRFTCTIRGRSQSRDTSTCSGDGWTGPGDLGGASQDSESPGLVDDSVLAS